MKLINIVLSLIVGIVIYLLLTSSLYFFFDPNLKSTEWIFWWILLNSTFSGVLALEISSRFYKWFKSHTN
jgi:hypothetical protein